MGQELYMADHEAISTFARQAWMAAESGRDFAVVIRAFVDDVAKLAVPEDDTKFIALLRDRLLGVELAGSLRVTGVVKSAVLELIHEVNSGAWPALRYEYHDAA
jgi:hypothetical protein